MDSLKQKSNSKIVNAYRNLTHGCISTFKSGEKVQHYDTVTLKNVRFHVREGDKSDPKRGTRQWTIKNKRKCVHAFVKGYECDVTALAEGVSCSYNPYNGGHFYRKDTGEPITSAEIVTISTSGIIAFNVN